jgi:GWxTD domain-containing protein
MGSCRYPICSVLVTIALLCPASSVAQDGNGSRTDNVRTPVNGVGGITSTSPCFERRDLQQEKQRENKAIANLPQVARFWLTEDVVYLISPEERCAFLQLATDKERSHFIEQFWSRRASDPTSLENSFKQAHYNRIAVADEKYGTQVPGWKTDRGRVYVTFGPPDFIESHQAGEGIGRTPEEGAETYQYSREVWHYKHVEGMEENLELEFVDPSESGDYRLAIPAEMKDDLIFTPRYNLGLFRHEGVAPESAQSIELHIGPVPRPQVQFKDLEAMVVSRIVRDQVRFSHRIEFSKATNATTLTRISIYLPNDRPSSLTNDGALLKGFEVFGRISEPSGWVVETFEKTSLDGRRDSAQCRPDCQVSVAIAPGTYRLAIAVKNVATGESGVLHTTIGVPSYEKLSAKKSRQ